MIVLILAACIGAAVYARYLSKVERTDGWADLERWHLLHGPTDGCPECVGK